MRNKDLFDSATDEQIQDAFRIATVYGKENFCDAFKRELHYLLINTKQ